MKRALEAIINVVRAISLIAPLRQGVYQHDFDRLRNRPADINGVSDTTPDTISPTTDGLFAEPPTSTHNQSTGAITNLDLCPHGCPKGDLGQAEFRSRRPALREHPGSGPRKFWHSM
jgi:hypothetical protein